MSDDGSFGSAIRTTRAHLGHLPRRPESVLAKRRIFWQPGQRILVIDRFSSHIPILQAGSRRKASKLRQNASDHDPRHVRQPEIPARVAESELLVVKSQQMQQRCMQVMHVDLVLGGPETEFVRGTVGHAALYAAAG